MRERDLMQAVRKAARLRGWLEYHTFDSRRSTPGFPDWIALREERMLVVEFKTTSGAIRKEQQQWLRAFEMVPGAEVHIWRPEDWTGGAIDKVLV